MAGHIRKLDSGRWQARFPRGRGLYRTRSFDRKIDATKWLDAQNVARDRGHWTDPKAASERFETVSESWVKSRRNVSAVTRARDESVIRNLVLPYFADMELRHITPEEIDAWVGHLDEVEGKAPATTRKAFNLISMVLDRAVATKKIPINPAKVKGVIELPQIHKREMHIIEPHQIAQLAQATGDRYRALILAAAYSGCRWGELTGLQRRALDLDRREISVVRTLTEVRGRHEWKDRPKTDASNRVVKINPFLVEVLSEHLEDWPAIGQAPIFTGPNGGLLRRSAFRSRIWLPAVRSTVGEPLTFHDLRHCHVSMLIRENVHVKVISSRLGHSDIGVTMNTYAHLFPGSDEAAADALENVMIEAERHERGTENLASVSKMARTGTEKGI